MQLVPIQPLASQAFQITLAGQACSLALYAKTDPDGAQKLYMDMQLNSVSILSGKICQNRNLLVRYSYLGFIGDLAVVDTQGSNDPQWNGLGARWQLVYLSPGDYEVPT